MMQDSSENRVKIENSKNSDQGIAGIPAETPFYRALVNESPALICRLTAGLEVEFANAACCNYFARDDETMAGIRWLELVHPSDRSGYLQRVRSLSPAQPCVSYQQRFIRPGGEVRWLFCTDRGLFEHGRLVRVHTVAADCTEQRASRARRAHAARMAAVGALATGVAHELNQPLNVMRLALQNTLKHMRDGTVDIDFLQAKLERIDRQIGRAAAIVDQMQIFGRKASFEPAEFDPTVPVENALGLLREALADQDLVINWRPPASCRRAVGFPDQLEQIVSSLVFNAADAIAERGRQAGSEQRTGVIDIELVDDPRVESISLVVRDNGGGIPEDVVDKIFEPFFTTKPVGKGTGLGLSLAFGMLQDMGGGITAGNHGDGAEFRVHLPVAGGTSAD